MYVFLSIQGKQPIFKKAGVHERSANDKWTRIATFRALSGACPGKAAEKMHPSLVRKLTLDRCICLQKRYRFSGRPRSSVPAGPQRSVLLFPGTGRSLPDTLEKIRGMCLFDIRHSPAADRNLIVVLKKDGIIINLLHILKVYNNPLRAGHEKII